MVVVVAERACELLLTAEEELLVEERAWEPLTEELLPLERVVVPLEREAELLELLELLERVAVVLVPLERVACWLLPLLERDTCELLLPLERVALEELLERVACWLLPLLERDTCELLLPLERELEELEVVELPVERVVVEPPPERDWASISGAVSMDRAITNEAA